MYVCMYVWYACLRHVSMYPCKSTNQYLTSMLLLLQLCLFISFHVIFIVIVIVLQTSNKGRTLCSFRTMWACISFGKYVCVCVCLSLSFCIYIYIYTHIYTVSIHSTHIVYGANIYIYIYGYICICV